MSDTAQAPPLSWWSRRRSLVIGAALLLLPFVLFWQTWWPDSRFRQVFQYGDFVEQHYPMRVFVADEIRHGHLPLWDPYTFSGEPAVAMSLFAPYYPPGFWEVAFPKLPFEALELEAIFHLGLAGLFTFVFVRHLTGNDGAGLLAGLAFGLGGYLTSYPMLQIVILETAVWLPAGLWLLEIALGRRSLSRVALAGAIYGFGILAGHPQTFLYIGYLTAVYFLFRVLRLRLPIRFVIPAGIILGGAALGISAAHWLPGLQMYALSPRAGLTYTDISNGFRPAELWGLLRPNPGQWSPLYVGLIPFALALIGLALRRRAETWFWGVIAVAALLLSLGRFGFLYPVFFRFVPGFSTFRDQERIALLVSFSLAVLAGYGCAAVAQRWWAKSDRVKTEGKRSNSRQSEASRAYSPDPSLEPHRDASWPVHPLKVTSGMARTAPTVILVLFIFFDLYRANNGVILQTPPAGGYFAKTPIVTHIQSASLQGWRTSSEGLLPGDGESGLVFQIRDIVGSGPLYQAAYDRFLAQVPEERWWRMLNVQHLITRRELSHGALRLVRQDGDLRLYQVFQNATASWIVHTFKLASSQSAAIQATGDPGLDPFEQAVLEAAPALSPLPPSGQEDTRLVAFENERVLVDATLTAPGILVLSEVAYPGWTVRANGVKIEPLRAYGLLRAVALPAGQWRVEWRFEPVIAYLGLVVSLLTVVTVGIAIWRPIQRGSDDAPSL